MTREVAASRVVQPEPYGEVRCVRSVFDVIKFFEEPQAAAILKLGILRRYLPTYFRKVGSTSDGAGTYIDGYAGRGHYEDGSPGSPALAVEAASALIGNRQIDAFFVEEDPESYEILSKYVGDERPDWKVLRGTIEERLPGIMGTVPGDMPVFAFMDPFGLGIPMSMLEEQLLARGGEMMTRRMRVNGTATEVLLNFSLPGLRRNAGHLLSPSTHPRYLKARETILARMDATLGGPWWRDIWLSGAVDREAQIVVGYRDRLCRLRGNYGVFTIPVADRLDGPPSYELMLLTQHEDGAWLMNDQVSLASEEYRKFCLQQKGELDLVDVKARDAQWVATIAGNIRWLLVGADGFKAASRITEIYGSVLGVARSTHFKRAVDGLVAAGEATRSPDKWPKNYGQVWVRRP